MRLRWAVQTSAWALPDTAFELLLSLLPQDERSACLRYQYADDQKRALVSRLLQRAAAAAALGVPHDTVTVQRTRGNKPYVPALEALKRPDHAPNWNYSVSHEGDYVILAAESVCIAGCDVAAPQRVRKAGLAQRPLADLLRTFQRQLTPAELDSIRCAGPDEEEQEAQFRKLWALKEAFVKATGQGLAFELADVEFAIKGSTADVRVQKVPRRDWAFHLHALGNGHTVAVARAPLSAVVDVLGGFKATFQKTFFAPGEWQAELAAPEPPFQLLSVADLVPPEHREAYEAAGGDVF